jgi:hypothetical protein
MFEFRSILFACSTSIAASLYFQYAALAQSSTKPSSNPPIIISENGLTKGSVEGPKYKNASIGLEFNPPPELKFETPEIKGTLGTQLVKVGAYGERKRFSASEAAIFYADLLSYYSEGQRSTEAYLRKVVKANGTEGFEPVKGDAEGRLGGVPFARVDFRKDEVYEVVFVRACKTYAFVFIFAGPDMERVNGLIARTGVELDLQLSGCGPRPSKSGASQKK